MIEQETLEQVADQYRHDGYSVTLHPLAADLPAVLADAGVDLVARNDREAIAVLVRRRENLLDLDPAYGLPDPAPGWHLDLVVLPKNGDVSSSNGVTRVNANVPEWGDHAAPAGL